MKKTNFPRLSQVVQCSAIVLSTLTLSILGCEKDALGTASDSLSRPVVEAFLQPGQIPQVKVSKQLPYNAGSDDSVQYVQGLQVRIESGDGVSHSLEFVDDSVYRADGSWIPEAGQTYRLLFEEAGKAIQASTSVPPKPLNFTASATSITIPSFDPGGGSFPTFPDPVELSWDNPDGAYYLVVVENIESSPVAIYDEEDGRPPRPSFRSEPEQVSEYQIGFQNFKYYGRHLLILYRLNAEYAALYDDNGNSSQNLSTPYTNIEGGLGIFTGINSDTLEITVHQ